MTPDEQTISEILEELAVNHMDQPFGCIPKEAMHDAIKQYAKQQCIAFVKWLECNAYYDGDGWYKDDMLTTIENLYTLFLNSNK
jgi:hypothetical protein